MKTTLLALILALFCSLTAFAKDKKVYDLTGTVSFESFHSDSSASMTVNGQTYNAYCSTEGSNISCSDTGGVFEATLADGTLVQVSLPDMVYSTSSGNPVLDAKDSKTFHYRLADHRKKSFFCVPDSKSKEACYAIDRDYDAQMKKLHEEFAAKEKSDRLWCAAPLTDEEKQQGHTNKPAWCDKYVSSAVDPGTSGK